MGKRALFHSAQTQLRGKYVSLSNDLFERTKVYCPMYGWCGFPEGQIDSAMQIARARLTAIQTSVPFVLPSGGMTCSIVRTYAYMHTFLQTYAV